MRHNGLQREGPKGAACCSPPPGLNAKDDSGSVLVLTAVAMLVLLGFAALVTDAGMLYLHRLSLSNAVDAAALAGVQELPRSAWAAEKRAVSYGGLNGVAPQGLTVQISPDRHEITVEAARQVSLFFARVLGINFADVGALAKARVGSVAAYGRGAVPLGIEDQDFTYGKQYFLKDGPQPGDGVYKGNFGPLALGGRGAATYENNLTYGYEGQLRIGDVVWTEPGNMAGPTARAIRHRIQQDPQTSACTWDNITPGCSRLVVVPVIKGYTKGGRNQVEIVGFAAFFLEGTGRRGRDNYIIGRFVEMAVDGEVGDGKDYGLRAYRLVE